MKVFKDYAANDIKMAEDVLDKIRQIHPETGIKKIEETLLEPDEVRKSRHKEGSRLYYRKRLDIKGKNRFTSVVVKERPDGHWVESAMTTSSMKQGEVLYKKKELE